MPVINSCIQLAHITSLFIDLKILNHAASLWCFFREKLSRIGYRNHSKYFQVIDGETYNSLKPTIATFGSNSTEPS